MAFFCALWGYLVGHGVPRPSKQVALAADGDLMLKLGHGGAGYGDGCADLGDVADPVARVGLAVGVVHLHAPEVVRLIAELLDDLKGGLLVVTHGGFSLLLVCKQGEVFGQDGLVLKVVGLELHSGGAVVLHEEVGAGFLVGDGVGPAVPVGRDKVAGRGSGELVSVHGLLSGLG